MRNYKIGQSVLISFLVVLSASFVPNLPMVLMTSRVLAQTVDERKAEADKWFEQGIALFQTSQFKVALLSFQQALQIYREINDRTEEANTLSNLGSVYYSLGDYKKAIDSYQQSLEIAKQINDRIAQARALNNLGLTYIFVGDYKKAIELLQESLVIAEEIEDLARSGNALLNLGIAYSALGNHEKAIDFYQQGLKIYRKIGDRAYEARALGNLGFYYYSLGDDKKAIDFHQQSLEIFQKNGDRPSEARAVNGLGSAYNSLGEYKKAIDFHQQGLAISKELGDRSGVHNALSNLGSVYVSLEDYKKAIELLQQSLVIAREIGERNSVGSTLNDLGYALFKSGNLLEAEKVLKQGIEVWKSQRGRLENRNDLKIDIFEEQARTYLTLQQVLIAQNKNDAALEVAESGRARAFVDLLTSRLSPNDNISSATEPTINQIKQISKAQNSTLVQYSIIYDVFKIAGRQQAKESQLYIWVIKPSGEVTFRKADLKPLWQKENTTLAELVTTSRNFIGARGAAFRGIDVSFNPDAPKATNKLKRLHELLINPIADLLPKNPSARVTFIPQSSLFLVPFPALQDKSGKYLIEKHTILTSPSIQVLELTREKRQQIGQRMGEWQRMGNDILIVGNPTMPKVPPKIGEAPQQLTPLPGAEREAKAIAKLFNTQALIGNQATETKVTQLLPKARLIHLATHGLFDNVQGLNSGIALAPNPPLSPLIKEGNEKGDGLLTAGEILDLKLNAELVVLSACDTGRGKISGDGVIGLSRSLISAGVPSVLVSLWAVPDAPTAELMTEFYQNLQNNPDKAQALRQAMLKTMKQHPNPRDWAAFTLIGEAE
ncbi:MAG: CHAT domain-containing tetratricopeptide repeat protein [Rivularia sp. (in: cyanobacteria)]